MKHVKAVSRKQYAIGVRDITDDVVQRVLEDIGLPISYSALLMHQYGVASQLLPTDFLDYEVEDAWQSICFAKKCIPSQPSGASRRAMVDEYLKCETACATTNHLFNLRKKGLFSFSSQTEQVLALARVKIRSWLGSYSSRRHQELSKHGPGSDLSLPRRASCLYNKWSSKALVSPSCQTFIREVMDSGPDYWSTMFSEQVNYSRFDSVPKSVKTDRPITVEPRWNMYWQLGIGYLIAERLRSRGIFCLSTQPAKNRHLASIGYSHGLATMDLSSASDRLAFDLIEELLPHDWLKPLVMLRSVCINVGDSRLLHQAKFSGMGNGFTFPLQSLVFRALTDSVCALENVDCTLNSVFGDDIIVPSSAYHSLSRILTDLGLEVNHGKSFAHGPFRESCGGDYFLGIDIRPVFLKKRLNNVQTIIDMAQRLFESSYRRNRTGSHRRKLMALRKFLRASLPDWARMIGPRGLTCLPALQSELVNISPVAPSWESAWFEHVELHYRSQPIKADSYRLLVRLTSGGFGDFENDKSTALRGSVKKVMAYPRGYDSLNM